MLPVSLSDVTGTLEQAAAAKLHTANAMAISSRLFLPAPSDPDFSPVHLMYFNSNPTVQFNCNNKAGSNFALIIALPVFIKNPPQIRAAWYFSTIHNRTRQVLLSQAKLI